MVESKPWDWSKNESDEWLIPAMESCYLAESWTSKKFYNLLDLGCGLGRHSVYFSKKGFCVKAIDLSEFAVKHLNNWAETEKLSIETKVCDMLILPFPDNSIDCIMAYNVIYHTDTQGFIKALSEIERVLKPNGEMFITLISKNTWSFQKADEYVRVDENTILRNESDTEMNVPHFYVDIGDIKKYFCNFNFLKLPVEQTLYDMEKPEFFSKHFNIIISKK